MQSNIRTPRAKTFIAGLAATGRYHFSSDEIREALGVSQAAAKLALNRLAKQGLVASPARSFYVIVPPEYQRIGCLPADQFIPALMDRAGRRYYVGLLSAAERYGAAHHRPQVFQVMLAKNRRPIVCGKVRVSFIARKRIDDVAVQDFNTPRGTVSVSTVEATAVDLAGYPQHAGGLDNVATVLFELSEQLDPKRLVLASQTAPMPWAQRLGYLLEVVGAGEKVHLLKDHVQKHARDVAALQPAAPRDAGERSVDWKLQINATVDVEA